MTKRSSQGASAEYGSHRDYVGWVNNDAEARFEAIASALRKAFASAITRREVEVIDFHSLEVSELAHAIASYPVVVKPLLVACNVAGRAIERDLGVKNLDTYQPNISRDTALILAGYLRPFLPRTIELPALCHLDRVEFIDKEIRKFKGRWEDRVRQALVELSGKPFEKTKFTWGKDEFEIDAALRSLKQITHGCDVKRIEARKDVHKRCDEIVNKANKLKSVYPPVKFAAIIYYPFVAEHGNIRDRLQSPNIDSVVFASENSTSIETAVKLLLEKWQLRKS